MERRLAAILSADVVGFSRLMELDEEGTLATLRTYRDEIDRNIAARQGRIFGSAGDSVIAEFASPVEAVRGAVDIQRELAERNVRLPQERRMQMRIGVNLGDVMVEGDDLFGDGVNIATRLEALADPNAVFISGSVFDQIKNKVDESFEDLGTRTVKNIAEPVRVYRVRIGGVRGELTKRNESASLARSPAALAAAAFVVIAVVAVAVWSSGLFTASVPIDAEPSPSTASVLPSERPTIAVLPFADLSPASADGQGRPGSVDIFRSRQRVHAPVGQPVFTRQR